MDEMYGVVKGAYICNLNRTQELSNRMYNRNVPSHMLQAKFGMRPVSTKYAIMPIVDQRPLSNVPIIQQPTYNTQTQFNPGDTEGPWSGFASKIDDESKLRNIYFALQHCEQPNYVPSSQSDLYKVHIDSKPQVNPFPYLSENEEFAPFNPNVCNVGHDFFNNSTRVQRMDAK